MRKPPEPRTPEEELHLRLLLEQFAPVPSWGRCSPAQMPHERLAEEHLMDLAEAIADVENSSTGTRDKE